MEVEGRPRGGAAGDTLPRASVCRKRKWQVPRPWGSGVACAPCRSQKGDPVRGVHRLKEAGVSIFQDTGEPAVPEYDRVLV